MAHHPNNRRSLAAPGPKISKPTSDPAGKRHPTKSPATTAATAVVYNLTNHFSKLQQPNPKPTKSQQNPPPQKQLVDTHLQVKALSKSANLVEPSTQKIGKQGRRVVSEISDNKKVEERENEVVIKVPTTTKTVERRSFCDAQVELGNYLVTNCAKVVSADMPPLMQIHAVGFARKIKDSLEKFTSKSLALSLKKEFDGAYGPAWHCIVGISFGSFVTHSVGGFLYFSLDQKVYILLFKTSVQRAE